MKQIIASIIIAASILFSAYHLRKPEGFGGQRVLLPADKLTYSFVEYSAEWCDVKSYIPYTDRHVIGTIVMRRTCNNLGVEGEPEMNYVMIDIGGEVVVANERAVIPLD